MNISAICLFYHFMNCNKFPVFCSILFPFGQPLRQNPAVIFIAYGQEGWVWIVNELRNKRIFPICILLLIHLSIQTKPSWPGLLLPNYAFQHNTLLFPILSQRQMGGHWWWLCLHTFIGGCGQEGLTVWACPPSSGGGRLLSAEHNLPCPAGLHLSQYQIAERC